MTRSEAVLTAIIEDHPLFRDAIAAVVESMPSLRLGAVVDTPSEAMERLEADPPGLVLVDFSLDDASAPELISAIRDRFPSTRCLVLSGHLNADYAEQSLAAGADGYILKGRPEEFEEAVTAILNGDTYVSEAVSSD